MVAIDVEIITILMLSAVILILIVIMLIIVRMMVVIIVNTTITKIEIFMTITGLAIGETTH